MDANYDPWSTHVPALSLAVQRYGTRVLEIGAGWYSTPLLHTLSDKVVTIETDHSWASKFQSLSSDRIVVVDNLMQSVREMSSLKWDVVFIDCEGNHFRLWIANIFVNKPCCVVAHDTQESYWNEIIGTTKYVKHFDFIMPRTSHLSNVVEVNK